MNEEELMKLTPGELTDLGICPTCFNRKHNGAVFGTNEDKLGRVRKMIKEYCEANDV